MKLLILGSTRFLGRYLTEDALNRGHKVTLFNRGNGDPDLYPDAERLVGDRNGELEALKGRQWDAVIDTCGFVPLVVSKSAQLLSESVGHYTFISSCSVYDNLETPGIGENHPLKELSEEQEEEIRNGPGGPAHARYYGELKALCEQELKQAMPSRYLNVRAGLIVGPHDYTDRFTYWVKRVSTGGEVLAPERKDKEIQFIDVRDLAQWILDMAETKRTGTYNVTGPESSLTMEKFLHECRTATGSNASFTWVSEDCLMEQNIQAWSELPLWIPDKHKMSGLLTMKIEQALKEGLRFRPLTETIRDTLSWESTGAESEKKAGLDSAKEKEVLEIWNQSQA